MVEYFDKDFLGNQIDIGDTVIFEAPKYRDFAIGKVITKAPKSCQIEYINDWNYPSKGHKEVVRQYYGQIIKHPTANTCEAACGEWIVCGDGEFVPFVCTACGKTTSWYHKQTAKFCPNCGTKMKGD